MSRLGIALGLFAACSSHKDNGNGTIDAPAADSGGGSGTCMPAVPITPCTPVMGSTVALEKLGTLAGGASALLATSPPDDGRLFVVGQSGQIWIFQDGQQLPDPFIDITSDTMLLAEAPPGERGLLGLAFHPNYSCNGYFYVSYTTANADVVERFSVSATDPNTADPTSGVIILSVPDPAENHNGSMLNFGSDGYLYISEGDGGNQGDPPKNGQAILRTDPTCVANGCEPLLAKILRIDVDHPANGKMYGIPANNAYATGGVGEPEILIRGLRNPWRWSFDAATGDMYIGDVGQDTYEEVDVIPAAMIDGTPNNPVNLGWSMYEGSACYDGLDGMTPGNGNGSCDPTGKTFPELVRTHAGDNWHAVIGGAVYRGACFPQIQGNFYVSDNTVGGLTQAVYNPMMPAGSRLMSTVLVDSTVVSPSSVHADSSGEIYETDTAGDIYHVTAHP
ncbi:MAG TPA: PQQ-dependent sugar dehydrogenase [Kofleriaceae bacterium]|jgi:glucose/arabinose dehydrogenase